MMNYPGVLARDAGVMAKLRAARGRIIDGHAPLVSGPDLDAYILAGPSSDHESTNLAEAREKLRKGMHVHLRQGSFEHNLEDLLPLLTCDDAPNISFVSDDRHPLDLRDKGHLDSMIRLATAHGVPAMRAVQAASINTARHYGIDGRRGPGGHGALAPGYRADFLLLDDLDGFSISETRLGGLPTKTLDFTPSMEPPAEIHMHTAGLEAENLRVPAGPGRLRVIGVRPHQLLTDHLEMEPGTRDGLAVADPDRDVAKLAVFERHQGTGNVGLGFVKGLGLLRGALASTIAHDSHNLLLAGVDDEDMVAAGLAVARTGGGFAVALGGEVLARLPLPLAGLMSPAGLDAVCSDMETILNACRRLGSPLEDPFSILQFLALPVIPSLKLTDKGLVDVDKFAFTSLWTGRD